MIFVISLLAAIVFGLASIGPSNTGFLVGLFTYIILVVCIRYFWPVVECSVEKKMRGGVK